VHPNAQLSACGRGVKFGQNVATKEHKKQARGLIEGLEYRVHLGPPIHDHEISSAREFLRQKDFSPVSDYFDRLVRIQDRLGSRSAQPALLPGKRNYGGEAAGYWMQVQSAYDHVILSTCWEGDLNFKHGRVKISHRFNQGGRVDFVELKFLRSLHPCLDGAIRKLLTVSGYQDLQKGWHTAEAFVLEVLPRELVFLCEDIFRCPRNEVLAWLVNIGHGLLDDLLKDLRAQPPNGHSPQNGSNPDQLCLRAVLADEVALPILEKGARLHCSVELQDPKTVVVRYASE
jgi:hypothetical protein